MPGSLNKVQVIGHLGGDPERKAFQNGGSMVSFSIATNETWKDRTTGERREATEWHRVAIFSPPLCDIAMRYLRKGAQVYIEGKLETRKWQDAEGRDQSMTRIALYPYRGEMTMLGGRANAPREAVAQSGPSAFQDPYAASTAPVTYTGLETSHPGPGYGGIRGGAPLPNGFSDLGDPPW